MTVPPVPDYQSTADIMTLRRQVRSAREALAKAKQEIEIQICGLDKMTADLERRAAPRAHATPFEAAPKVVHESRVEPALTIEYVDEPRGHIVLEATRPSAIEQHLEQATLEELNLALSKAFSQVSGRSNW